MAAHPPRRIVVGVDTGGSSDNAVAAAVDLSRRFGAGIELVHAVRPTRFGHAVEPDRLEAARRAMRLHLEATLAGALLPYVSEEHHLVVRAGHPAAVLLERAAEPDTGLVVLGAHRRHGLLDLKNTAQTVIMRAEFEQAMERFDWGGVGHRTVFAEESPVTQVVAMQDEVDLVLLGTHGRTGLSALVLGNTAASVLREVHLPVVTLRSPGREWLL